MLTAMTSLYVAPHKSSCPVFFILLEVRPDNQADDIDIFVDGWNRQTDNVGNIAVDVHTQTGSLDSQTNTPVTGIAF